MQTGPGAVFGHAVSLLSWGFSVIPIKTDGSKAPALASWTAYQARAPTGEELERWFDGADDLRGIGLVCGAISSLEVIDFDGGRGLYGLWTDLVEEQAPGLVASLPVVKTPKLGGFHVYLHREKPGRNSKLARDAAGATLIETRGEGGYVLTPGGAAAAHPSGKPYTWLQPGVEGWSERPYTPDDAYQLLLSSARAMTEHAEHEHGAVGGLAMGEGEAPAILSRPGEDFARRASWEEILGAHGWAKAYQRRDGAAAWRRPGKNAREGISATTGYCKSRASGEDLLYVFSTNAVPFEGERAYGRFAAFALLEHGGDFKAAARMLADKGYGGTAVLVPNLEERLAAARAILDRSSSDPAAAKEVRGAIEAMTANDATSLMSKLVRERSTREFDELPDGAVVRYVARACIERRLDDLELWLVLRGACFLRGVLLPAPAELVAVVQDVAAYRSPSEAVSGLSTTTLEALREAPSAVPSADPEARRRAALEALRELIGIPLAHILKSTRSHGVYSLGLDDGQCIPIGMAREILSQAAWHSTLFDGAKLVLKDVGKKEWRGVRRLILDAVEEEDDRDEFAVFLDTLYDEFIDWEMVASAVMEEQEHDSVQGRYRLIDNRQPLVHEDSLCISAPFLSAWLKLNKGIFAMFTLQFGLRKYLKNIGFRQRSFSTGATSRSYYCRAMDDRGKGKLEVASAIVRAKQAQQNQFRTGKRGDT